MRNSRKCRALSVTLLLLLFSFTFFGGFGSQVTSFPPGSGDWMVVPGKRVGAVALGDPAESIFGLFPKPSIGSYAQPGHAGLVCGTRYTIGLLQDAKHPGFIAPFARDGKVVEIEAGGAHYRTEKGIGSNSPPEDVGLRYKGMRAHLFLHCCDESMNEGPLILWTDEHKGIAFTFEYPTKGDTRLLVSTMVVFKPGESFCVQGSVFPDPERWRELAPYSLGQANASAMLR